LSPRAMLVANVNDPIIGRSASLYDTFLETKKIDCGMLSINARG